MQLRGRRQIRNANGTPEEWTQKRSLATPSTPGGYVTIVGMDTTRTDLLTGASVDAAGETTLMGGCCGGGSCMCGSSAGRQVETPQAETAPNTGTEFLVTGMTCGHCVSSVKEEVGAIAGVEAVEVVLKNGGESRVTVRADGPLDIEAVRAAVEEAGYQLV